jgi:hypothetical protein
MLGCHNIIFSLCKKKPLSEFPCLIHDHVPRVSHQVVFSWIPLLSTIGLEASCCSSSLLIPSGKNSKPHCGRDGERRERSRWLSMRRKPEKDRRESERAGEKRLYFGRAGRDRIGQEHFSSYVKKVCIQAGGDKTGRVERAEKCHPLFFG